MPTGALRAPSHNFNAFVIESIIDELAHAGGVDPIALRLSYLGDARGLPVRGRRTRRPTSRERLKHVLTLAAEKSGWGTPLPKGRGRGIAVHYTFGSYAAEVAEVSVDAQKRVRVHRVVAVDRRRPAGESAEPRSADARAASSTASARRCSARSPIARGRTVQSTFEDYPLIRNRDAPEIEVHIVPSREHPTGFGEIALPPIAPAVANAIFAATGTRVTAAAVCRERIQRGRIGQ